MGKNSGFFSVAVFCGSMPVQSSLVKMNGPEKLCYDSTINLVCKLSTFYCRIQLDQVRIEGKNQPINPRNGI